MQFVFPLLALLCNVAVVASEDKPFLSFTSDISSLSYRPIFINNMVEKAIQTGSSLKIEFKASKFVNFGFLKCGVYALATIANVREATFVLRGNELVNLRKMIGRTCASNNYSSSFDLVIHSPEYTKVLFNFTTLPAILQPTAGTKRSELVRSMYPLSVHFDLPANTSSFYPIQLKALTRRILRTTGSHLRIRVFTNATDQLKVSMDRCDWEVPDKHFRFSKEKVYRKDTTKAIEDLISKTCDSEWLVDTVNVHVASTSNSPVSGVITFDALYPKESQLTQREATTSPGPSVAKPLIKLSPKLQYDYLYIYLFIFGFVVLTLLVTWVRYNTSRHRIYHVADYDRFSYESVLP